MIVDGDPIKYKGITYQTPSAPINGYLKTLSKKQLEKFPKSIVFKWEVINNKLYFDGVFILSREDAEKNRQVFNGRKMVFAEWFSGKIEFAKGYISHAKDYWEQDSFMELFILRIKKGVVVGEIVFRKNFPASYDWKCSFKLLVINAKYKFWDFIKPFIKRK